MVRILPICIIMTSLSLSLACKPLSEVRDGFENWSFRQIGETMLTPSILVSLKEVHFSGSKLEQKQVVVEGHVAHYDKFGTYMVIKNQGAKLLVLLTDVVDDKTPIQGFKKSPIGVKVFGTISHNSDGLPFIKARSLKLAKL